MTYQDINDMTEELTGVPSAYYEFTDRDDIAPPFSVFYYTTDHDFVADDCNYQKISRFVWELYTDVKDFTTEASMESILASHGIVWTKYEEYDGDQRLHMTRYETDIVITPVVTATTTTTEEINNG